jgi:hypothetical protein
MAETTRKFKLKEIFEIRDSLIKLLNMELSAKINFRLAKVTRALKTELQDLETERQKLVEKYGEKDEAGNITVTKQLKEFNTEWEKVLEEEVDILIVKVPLEELDGNVYIDSQGTKRKLTMIDVANLEFLITEAHEAQPSKE